MRGVYHYERVHKDALQTCHTKQNFLEKPFVSKNESPTNDFQDLNYTLRILKCGAQASGHVRSLLDLVDYL